MQSKIFDHANSKIPDVRKFHHAEKIWPKNENI